MQPALFYTLLNTDISKPVLQVRLSISVSGQSAAVRTMGRIHTDADRVAIRGTGNIDGSRYAGVF